MRNLAGETTAHANAYIEDELTEACIPLVGGFSSKPSDGEVKASIRGGCHPFRFERAWYYWVVTGPVSIEIAREMYEDPRGRADVRVAGHCGCPAPEAPWTETIDGVECVTEYHIDSQEGLNLFAEKVLGTRPLPPTEEEQEAAKQIARENTAGIVIYEDSAIEDRYIAADQEVREIRNAISGLRHRLEDLERDIGGRTAGDVAGSLTTALMALYELENPDDARSFVRRAEGVRKMWDDLYANPTKYVLRAGHDG